MGSGRPAMKQLNILVIEDDDGLRPIYAELLESAGFQVDQAAEASDALGMVSRKRYDGVVLDMRLGEDDGLELMDRIKAVSPLSEVVISTGHASVETAVSAMNRGAFQYLAKPVDSRELILVMERAARQAHGAFEMELMAERLRRREQAHGVEGLIAVSPLMLEVIADAQDIAGLEKPVCIHGETGTGKEIFAHLVHRCSGRAEGPFNVLNCGSLTENLVDAELFGYEKGAFTGADKARPGIIAASHDGTLFLDEIGDIPMVAQVRLLRFLESGAVRPLGSTRESTYDVRIIAATHRDLQDEVDAGRFREDLYHRLVVLEIRLPPLRERAEDVHPLAEHFLNQMAGESGWELSPAAVTLLQQQAWSGNIRELRNEVERAWLRARRAGATTVAPEHFRLSGDVQQPSGDFGGYGRISLQEAELRHVQHVLDCCEQNRRQAAGVLGISERHIYRLLKAAEALSDP